MASFNDILEAQPQSLVGNTCQTGAWRETLTAEDQTMFDVACHNPGLRTVVIYRTMKQLGFKGTDSAFLRHRNGGCRCDVR